ncbi:MAG TPA: polynucleotide adenylyltransferase PcnB, partial [Myxococcaceae bacterium]|nr:polynucleotide adenylyltransferase PcnB [Myxococcaceae bacterium]
MTHDPLRPEGTPPESPSTDPERLVDEEEVAAGEAEEDEGFEDEEENGAGEDDAPDPLDAPVPEAPPPADAREPEPVPAALWESEADHLDASVPQAGAGAQAEIDPRLLDVDAVKVINRLVQNGHRAYLVGGCVRDLLLGRTPKDFDIATSALPSEVRGTFRNCRLIGRRFRLAHIYFKGGKIIEVSTFRANPITDLEPAADGGVGEERPEDLLINDDNVFGTAEQDARRRDFTINGLFYDVPAGRVLDFVRGRRDLDERLVRTIGDPERRMREDPIRLLRAVRFASRLSFEIEPRTYAAMEGAVEDLPRCAPPRLLEDTFRILRGGVAEPGLELLAALDALRFLLPPIDAYLKEHGPEGERTLVAFARAADRRVKAGELLEDAVLLAVLLVPLLEAAPEASPEAPGGVPEAVETMLQDLVKGARLPRRIAERCRMMLLAQSTLSGRRRRRGSLGSFRRHPLFQEALTVFACTVEATGK